MSGAQKRAPEVRFKGFTDDWEQRELGEVAEFSKGNGYTKNDLRQTGFPIVLYGRLYTKYETIINNVDTFVKMKDSSVISEGNEVIVPASGESAKDISRASVIGKPGFILGGDLNIIKSNQEIDSTFLALTISTGTQQKEMSKRAQGKSVVHLHNSDLKEIKLLYPKLKEQQQISTFFKNIDNLIALHQRKLELLKRLKQAYLQVMFTQRDKKSPKVRFAHFVEGWEQRELREIAEFNPKSTLPDKFEYVDLESVVGTNLVNHRAESIKSAPSRAQRLAKRGDVFYQTVRPYQKNNYLYDLPYDNYVFSTGYAQMRPSIDSYFLLSRVQEEFFVKSVLDRSTGTSYPAISSSDLEKIEIKVPIDSDEQVKIGGFFKRLDELINIHHKKENALKELKKLYLQKLFV